MLPAQGAMSSPPAAVGKLTVLPSSLAQPRPPGPTSDSTFRSSSCRDGVNRFLRPAIYDIYQPTWILQKNVITKLILQIKPRLIQEKNREMLEKNLKKFNRPIFLLLNIE